MNKQVIIVSDSTTDLGPELIERYGVKILPLGISLGGKQFTDGVDVDPDYIYAHYEMHGELPKTNAVNVADFAAFFQEQTSEGKAVVCFTISSEMSSTYNNACIAAGEFEDVYVVDTNNLSTGGGLLVLTACDMATAGKSAREIAEACSALVDRVDASFVIDDLTFLHKGGRCSALTALGANILQIKPSIVVRDGKMTVGRKYRGKFPAVLKHYIADLLADPDAIVLDRVFVTHAGCEEQIVEDCIRQVRETADFKEIHVTRAGCTVSSHCGRNTLGVLFVRKERSVAPLQGV